MPWGNIPLQFGSLVFAISARSSGLDVDLVFMNWYRPLLQGAAVLLFNGVTAVGFDNTARVRDVRNSDLMYHHGRHACI